MDNNYQFDSSEKVNNKFICECCDYKSSRLSQYNRHIATPKHKQNILDKNKDKMDNTFDPIQKSYICKCGNKYKYLSGLCKHKKKCETKLEQSELNFENKEKEENPNPTKTENDKEMIYKLIQQNIELVTQNQEFKQMMIDIQKQVIDLASKTNVTNNNNCNNTTNKFNMNIFLNETCKDAMNIMDFVTSLPLSLQDLEETGKQGYVKGLSRILINGLKDVDVSKRPIHCSDLKRETLYVKDNNVWEKEDAEKNRIKNAIKYISLKNAKQITPWTKLKENEGYKDSYNKKSDQYLKLVYEANGGDDDELNKIIKNITPNVTIDKNLEVL